MSDLELNDAVAHFTGEDSHEIRRHGFMLTGPVNFNSDLDPECMLNLSVLREAGFIDWDALGYGCRATFFDASTKARGVVVTSGSSHSSLIRGRSGMS